MHTPATTSTQATDAGTSLVSPSANTDGDSNYSRCELVRSINRAVPSFSQNGQELTIQTKPTATAKTPDVNISLATHLVPVFLTRTPIPKANPPIATTDAAR